MYQLEIAVFTIQGALQAADAGADRLELCENPADGGTTPSMGTLKQIREIISIPVFPIIRPRGGNFVYDTHEINVMKEDILLCKQLGFEGVVFGVLDKEGNVDMEVTNSLTALAHPMQVTFHRAFDRTVNPMQALADIITCGCSRILTSGQYPNVMDGLTLISDLIIAAENKIIIMPGSGLNSKNILSILKQTKALEFHTAARKKMINEGIFSPESMNEQLSFIGVDEEEVRAIKHILSINKSRPQNYLT